MRIGIDVSRYFDKSGGVGIYAANLLKYLLKIDKNNEYNAYSFFYNCFPPKWKHKKIINEFRKYGKVNFSQINLPTSILKGKWNNASIEKKEKLLASVDVIHSTAYMIPELFNARLVVTIHDLSFLIFPEYHTKENYELVLRNLFYLNSRPDMVICDSQQTKKDVIKYFHVPEGKLRVVYLGVSDSFREEICSDFKNRILEKYELSGKYLLCVASIEPRKNFLRIINAFSEFIKQEEYKGYSLVCVGGRGWKNIEIYSLVKQKNLEGKIKFLGFIEESELAPIYNQAEIFLYPSLYEGFGLPVLEAMACAVPVVTSNVSSLPEVASDAAMLINPYSEKDIYTAVCSLLENGALRKKLISKGLDRVREFSWKKTARGTLKVYHEVYNL